MGACLVARTETLRRLGPFDERIFLYGEDIDLGLRAADAGVETVFRPDARVVHHGRPLDRAGFGGEPFELLARQRRAVIGERRGEEAARARRPDPAATYLNRIALKTLTGRSTAPGAPAAGGASDRSGDEAASAPKAPSEKADRGGASVLTIERPAEGNQSAWQARAPSVISRRGR